MRAKPTGSSWATASWPGACTRTLSGGSPSNAGRSHGNARLVPAGAASVRFVWFAKDVSMQGIAVGTPLVCINEWWHSVPLPVSIAVGVLVGVGNALKVRRDGWESYGP